LIYMEEKALSLYKILKNHYGLVDAELEYSNIYELTIAVVLSAQTTDKQVNRVTKRLFSEFTDFKSLAKADISEVEEIIRSTGFYHSKAKNITALARAVTAAGGTLPRTITELTAFPGIGRKSANVIISQGFGIPGLAVDTHVGRIAHRIGLTSSLKPDIIEKELKSMLDPELWLDFHLLLINHGRKLCMARKPECSKCPAGSICSYYSDNQ
jgi:endonuclease-3